MPVDAFAQDAVAISPAQLIDAAPAPAVDMAETNPDRLLAFLYVAPQPCEALDRLLAG